MWWKVTIILTLLIWSPLVTSVVVLVVCKWCSHDPHLAVNIDIPPWFIRGCLHVKCSLFFFLGGGGWIGWLEEVWDKVVFINPNQRLGIGIRPQMFARDKSATRVDLAAPYAWLLTLRSRASFETKDYAVTAHIVTESHAPKSYGTHV